MRSSQAQKISARIHGAGPRLAAARYGISMARRRNWANGERKWRRHQSAEIVYYVARKKPADRFDPSTGESYEGLSERVHLYVG